MIPRTYRVARLVQPIAMLAVFAIVGFSKTLDNEGPKPELSYQYKNLYEEKRSLPLPIFVVQLPRISKRNFGRRIQRLELYPMVGTKGEGVNS